MAEESKAVVVPESVLKKQNRSDEWALAKKQEIAISKKKNADFRRLLFNCAKEYAKEYAELEKELIQLKGGFYVDPEAKLLIIIRIRGINAMNPKTRKILQLLRLRQIPQLEECERADLQACLRKLNQRRIALTNDSIIEQALGKHGILCTEDLIHEIMTVGPYFKEANNFLWPFKLKAPLGCLNKQRNHYVEGGDAGNREDYINEHIKRMN